MVILRNEIEGTRGGGVSIEHGQECAIVENSIRDNDIGVELWWDEDKDLVHGPFGENRDTSSRDHRVLGNAFVGNAQDVVVKKTTGVLFDGNVYSERTPKLYVDAVSWAGEASGAERSRPSAGAGPAQALSVKDCFVGMDGSRASGHVSESTLRPGPPDEPAFLAKARAFVPPEVPGNQLATPAERGARGGLDTIVMGEWGPWDFESGEPRPHQRTPGGVLAGARWDATWFSWPSDVDPRGDLGAWRALQFRPMLRKEVGNWTTPFATDEVRAAVGGERFGIVATASFQVAEAGQHRLTVISDDGVRVTLDGKVVLENWTWHPPTRDETLVELDAGAHRVELEYFQIDGASALVVDLERIRAP
jgi:hypothetical protein